MIVLTKEQQQKALDEYRARRAKINAENLEAETQIKNSQAILAARNSTRLVTVSKPHQCSICDDTIPQNTQAYYTPGRICAKSTRSGDSAFSASRYTCLKCREAQA